MKTSNRPSVQADVVLLPMDDDEPDFTADEVDDMWEFGGSDLDYEAAMNGEGCAFPGECCMPGPHTRDECHTAEMVEQHAASTGPKQPGKGSP